MYLLSEKFNKMLMVYDGNISIHVKITTYLLTVRKKCDLY